MDIMIAVKKKDYKLFNRNLITNQFNYKKKWYDDSLQLMYYDCLTNFTMLKAGDKIHFYIYGYLKFYAMVHSIQLMMIPPNSIRIYFSEIKENELFRDTKFLVKKFKGEKYFHIPFALLKQES